MSQRRPPRLAVWLLKWFGLTRDEAFAGDLLEEFRSGRTAGWFWRQTLTAIWTTAKSAKSDFVPLLIGWSTQLLIVEILVARHVHFGLYGCLLLVLVYPLLFGALVHASVRLELSEWWDILFKSFLGCMFQSGWIAFIDVLGSLIPAHYGLAPSGVRGYLWFNLLWLCLAGHKVVKSHHRGDPEGNTL